MTFPTVIETPLPLEPCTADTFIAGLEPRRGGGSQPSAPTGSTTRSESDDRSR